MVINRENYLKQLIQAPNNGMVKVITGIRRCGKSYLLFTLFRNYLMQQGKNIRKQLEVDFVCNKGSKRYYIQAALNLVMPEKQVQELNSLSKIDDSFKKIVIDGDHTITYHDQKGITFINIYNFMLDENSLDA